MAFSRLFSSIKATVTALIRRHSIVTAAVSYLAISYTAPPLVRYFNPNDDEIDADYPWRPFRFMISLMDRLTKVRETEDSVVFECVCVQRCQEGGS